MLKQFGDDRGFSLVEVLVAISISTIVLGLIVATLTTQQRNHITQERLVDMQQGMRAAFEMISSDVKMAGYDPSGTTGASILVADVAELQFQLDLNGDGVLDAGPPATPDSGELIRYALTNDANRDGIADATPCDLGREVGLGTGFQILAENIDALNFVYRDRDGNLLATPVANPSQIAAIQITVVARSGRTLPAFFKRHPDKTVYSNRQGDIILPAPNDDFRRMVLVQELKCRNLDLN